MGKKRKKEFVSELPVRLFCWAEIFQFKVLSFRDPPGPAGGVAKPCDKKITSPLTWPETHNLASAGGNIAWISSRCTWRLTTSRSLFTRATPSRRCCLGEVILLFPTSCCSTLLQKCNSALAFCDYTSVLYTLCAQCNWFIVENCTFKRKKEKLQPFFIKLRRLNRPVITQWWQHVK